VDARAAFLSTRASVPGSQRLAASWPCSGYGDDPGELVGYGPITAGHLRDRR
jgi:hypothetical protein